MSKTIRRIRRPGVSISPKGKIGITGPSYRVGGRNSGINISRRGVSSSVRTPLGTYNSRRGCRMTLLAILSLLVLAGLALVRTR